MNTAHNSSSNRVPHNQRGTKADSDATTRHRSVLLQETLSLLSVEPNDIVLDATLGGGGHAHALSSQLSSEGLFIGIDAESSAVERSKTRLKGLKATCHLVQENFRKLDIVLSELGVTKVHKVLFDLGWSSDQIADSGRGLTFQKDEPLVMTLADTPREDALTAHEIVNHWDEENLADILYHYGGERFSRRIAKGIVEARAAKAIDTTFQLVAIIEDAVPAFYKKGRLHPATRTFQALRITVNDEIGALKEGLRKAYDALEEEGRIAVITFHSLEDKIVKETFRAWAKEGYGSILTKKPIAPSREEVRDNPRSRSSKLRCFEKHTQHAKATHT